MKTKDVIHAIEGNDNFVSATFGAIGIPLLYSEIVAIIGISNRIKPIDLNWLLSLFRTRIAKDTAINTEAMQSVNQGSQVQPHIMATIPSNMYAAHNTFDFRNDWSRTQF